MRHTMLHEQLRRFYDGFPPRRTSDGVLCGVVGAMSAFTPVQPDITDPEERRISASG